MVKQKTAVEQPEPKMDRMFRSIKANCCYPERRFVCCQLWHGDNALITFQHIMMISSYKSYCPNEGQSQRVRANDSLLEQPQAKIFLYVSFIFHPHTENKTCKWVNIKFVWFFSNQHVLTCSMHQQTRWVTCCLFEKTLTVVHLLHVQLLFIGQKLMLLSLLFLFPIQSVNLV